jgi:hypothetical protein
VGASEIATDAVGTLEIAADAVGTSEISTDAVTSIEIAANAVGASEIGADAVTSSEIATDAVTSLEIATDAVGSAEIAADAVNSSEIATDAVTSLEIATDAVGSAEIAANAVTSSELANGSVTTSKIDSTGASTGQVLRYSGASVAWAHVDSFNYTSQVYPTKAYTMRSTDTFVGIDTDNFSDGTFYLTLPSTALVPKGKMVIVIGEQCSSVTKIYIDPTIPDTIVGKAPFQMTECPEVRRYVHMGNSRWIEW